MSLYIILFHYRYNLHNYPHKNRLISMCPYTVKLLMYSIYVCVLSHSGTMHNHCYNDLILYFRNTATFIPLMCSQYFFIIRKICIIAHIKNRLISMCCYTVELLMYSIHVCVCYHILSPCTIIATMT